MSRTWCPLVLSFPLVTLGKIVLCKEIYMKSIKNVEILPSKRFESHSQSANGLIRPFGVKNDKSGSCHGAKFSKNDTLPRSRNPENDTLFSGTSPNRKIYEYPRDLTAIRILFINWSCQRNKMMMAYFDTTQY